MSQVTGGTYSAPLEDPTNPVDHRVLTHRHGQLHDLPEGMTASSNRTNGRSIAAATTNEGATNEGADEPITTIGG